MVAGDDSLNLDLFRLWVPEEIINKIIVLVAFVDMIMRMFCIYSEIVMLPDAFGLSLFHNGSVRFDEGFAADGGCVRDHNGEWIIGHFERILIQTDSIEAINVILEDSSGTLILP
ncbi:hypothetical protein Gogos_016803 [Gossypium gossypioides]|uniref:Uncharacterized protein n=1 Tax=Gossypium gossypioides TaxID=34282 RepID=A0A7J9B8R9_GOSGO|nr:hypothetical protein [Gossypium gossypioides]